jgi:hypothetical protein
VSSRAPHTFDAQEVTIACAVALLAQMAFLAIFSLPSPKLVEADISNENAQPIAVAITPVLKLGSKNPSPWQRRRPVPAKTPTSAPSPRAEKTPEAVPTTPRPETSAAPIVADAGRYQPSTSSLSPDSAAGAPAASTEGSEQGAVNGTETDPLKARAADIYRSQLLAWFMGRFHIRGKIPFDRLKQLRAHASVTVTADRKIGSFSIDSPSGDPTFDAEVTSTLSQIQASGVELPAPPPMYADILHATLPVGFQCNVKRLCE